MITEDLINILGSFLYDSNNALFFPVAYYEYFAEEEKLGMLSHNALRWYEKWIPFIKAWAEKQYRLRQVYIYSICTDEEKCREMRRVHIFLENSSKDLGMIIDQIHEDFSVIMTAVDEFPQSPYSDDDHLQECMDYVLKCLKRLRKLYLYFQNKLIELSISRSEPRF